MHFLIFPCFKKKKNPRRLKCGGSKISVSVYTTWLSRQFNKDNRRSVKAPAQEQGVLMKWSAPTLSPRPHNSLENKASISKVFIHSVSRSSLTTWWSQSQRRTGDSRIHPWHACSCSGLGDMSRCRKYETLRYLVSRYRNNIVQDYIIFFFTIFFFTINM